MAAPTIAAVGTAYSTPNNATTPMTATGGTMPTHQAGDVLLMFAFFDTGATTASQTLSTPAGWTSLGVDADNLTHGMLFHVYFKYAASAAETFTSPSFTGGTTGTTGASGIVRVMTLRPSGSKAYPSGVSAANLVANSGTATFITTAAQNITSIGGFTPDENDTLICVYGGKRDDWTGVAVLTGDSLTYTEQIDTPVTVGADAGMVVDTAPQTTAGAIAAKTFTVTGGATEKSCGRMFALSQAVAFATLERSAAITITPGVASVGAVTHIHERSASIDITPAVASAGEFETPGGFSPDDIAGLTFWMEGDTTGQADNTTLSTWQDSHTSNNDLTAGGAPTVQTAELNGLPIVRYDGVDDRHISSTITLNQPVTRFSVLKWRSAYASDEVALDGVGSFNAFDRRSSVIINIYAGAHACTVTTTPESWHTYTEIYNGASSSLRVDGGTASTGNAGASSPNGLRIGGDQTGGQWADVDVAEVIVYDSVLSSTDRANVESYLATKWGLVAAPTVHERSASVTITPAIASQGTFFSVFERSAAVAITPAVASSAQFFTIFSRSAAVAITPAIASVPQRVRLRSASVTITPAVASQAAFFSIFARSAAVVITPAIATAPQRVLMRATAVTITPAVTAAGQIEGGLVEHERSASITLTPSVASSATFYSIIERSAAVTLTPAIASAQMRVVMRQASVMLTPAIASSGAILQIWSRAVAITITPSISAAGFGGVIFETHLPLTVEVRDASLTVIHDEGETSIIFDSSESTVIYDETTTDVSSQGDREADVPEHLTSVEVAEPALTVDYEETPRTVEVP